MLFRRMARTVCERKSLLKLRIPSCVVQGFGLLFFLTATLGLVFCKDAAYSASSKDRPNLPIFETIFSGPVYYADGSVKTLLELALRLDPNAPRGTVKKASQVYDLLNVQLTVVDSDYGHPALQGFSRVLYRLSYAIDWCQNTPPESAYPWNVCYYPPGGTQRRHLVTAEFLILWNATPSADTLRAVGTPRLDDLSESCYLSGRIVQRLEKLREDSKQ
jgi:hypothetical protein